MCNKLYRKDSKGLCVCESERVISCTHDVDEYIPFFADVLRVILSATRVLAIMEEFVKIRSMHSNVIALRITVEHCAKNLNLAGE